MGYGYRMNMKPWMERIASGASVNAVAKEVGMSQATLDGQLRSRAGLKPEVAIRIARAYGANPVAALVEMGLLRPSEVADDAGINEARHLAWLSDEVEGASDEVLLAEIGRRLQGREDLGRGSR